MKELASPAFVLQEEKFLENAKCLRSFADEAGVNLILALKAFASYSVFPSIRDYFDGTTASSLNETKLGKYEFAKDVHFYAPVYTELDEILPLVSHFSFNSPSLLERDGPRVAESASVGLRINPEYSPVETDLYNPCADGSRLGVRNSLLPEKLPDYLQGFHSHNLCECFAEDLEATLAAIDERFGRWLPQLKWLNLGGGHLITDERYDHQKGVSALVQFKTKYPNLKIIMEPGSASAWKAGYLLATVLDIVQTDRFPVLMLDVSFSAHMPDCLEMPYFPAIEGAVKSDKGYMLGGSTCLAGDALGPYEFESKPQVGDRIKLLDMAHYTIVKTTMFNGVPHPSIYLLDSEKNIKSCKHFDYEDYRRRL